MLQSAKKNLESRSFAQAIQTLESALKLDQDHIEIRAALDLAREELQRSKAAARIVVTALADVKRGDWSGASEKICQAADLDQSNTEVKAVLARIERHIQDVLTEMDGLIAKGDFESAVRGLAGRESFNPWPWPWPRPRPFP